MISHSVAQLPKAILKRTHLHKTQIRTAREILDPVVAGRLFRTFSCRSGLHRPQVATASRFPDKLCMKRVYSDKTRRSTGQQPRLKSGFRSTGKLLVNPGFFPQSVYIGFRLFVPLARGSGQSCSMALGGQGTVVSWANRSVGAPSCPAPPYHCRPFRAPPRPDEPVVCPGFGFDRWDAHL